MIKLIRLFGLFVIICLIYGLGSAFNGNESTKINDDQKEQSTETVGNDNSEKSVSTNYADESNIYQIQQQNDVVDDKIENRDTTDTENKIFNDEATFEIKDYQPEEDKVEEKSEIITKTEIKEEVDNSNNAGNSSNNEVKKEDIIVEKDIESDIKEKESSKEEVIVEIDEEYEKLKKLYKYKNGTECYYASLKVYSQTYQENYKNAGCISGAYNGELLGYRIIIYFNDGTSMYYDEAI